MQAIRGARFWLIAFGFAYALWMVHADTPKLPELLAGAGISAVAATATELVRRERVAGITITARYLRRALTLLPSAARDCVALTRVAFAQLLRPSAARGRTVAIPFRHGGDESHENGRRALAQALGSFAPSTIVIGVDPEGEMLIAHQLAGSGDPRDVDPLELG